MPPSGKEKVQQNILQIQSAIFDFLSRVFNTLIDLHKEHSYAVQAFVCCTSVRNIALLMSITLTCFLTLYSLQALNYCPITFHPWHSIMDCPTFWNRRVQMCLQVLMSLSVFWLCICITSPETICLNLPQIMFKILQ